MNQDPFFNWIAGLTVAGLASTAISISGYLPHRESFNLGSLRLEYPAANRKLPLAVLGFGFCYAAWLKAQERKEWKRQYAKWQQHQEQLQAQQSAIAAQEQAIAAQARLPWLQQAAHFRAGEEVFPQLQPYLEMQAQLEGTQQHQPIAAQAGGGVAYPTPQSQPPITAEVVSPASPAPAGGTSSDYLQNLIEYPALVFGGMGAGKSWTVRYVAQQKVRAGHQVFLLDPHAASHEWQGIQHIGAGMDYGAISDFLKWYLAEITRRYQEFNRSGMSEEGWQESIRQQGRVISVLVEEMTNYAERLVPKELGNEFFKSAMSDSRKVLMPPLFVAHDRTLTCLGDAKGLARTRDASLLELELIPMVHPVTHKPVSSGKGRLKLPGHRDWMDVELPKVDRKITDFTGYGRPQTIYPTGNTQVPGNATIVTPPPQNFNRPDQQLTERERLEFLLDNSPDFQSRDPADFVLSEDAQILLNYLSMRSDGMTTRAIKKNWGSNNGYSAAQVEQFLTELLGANRVTREIRQSADAHIWRAKTGHGNA